MSTSEQQLQANRRLGLTLAFVSVAIGLGFVLKVIFVGL